jgi:hypothetical protein
MNYHIEHNSSIEQSNTGCYSYVNRLLNSVLVCSIDFRVNVTRLSHDNFKFSIDLYGIDLQNSSINDRIDSKMARVYHSI